MIQINESTQRKWSECKLVHISTIAFRDKCVKASFDSSIVQTGLVYPLFPFFNLFARCFSGSRLKGKKRTRTRNGKTYGAQWDAGCCACPAAHIHKINKINVCINIYMYEKTEHVYSYRKRMNGNNTWTTRARFEQLFY